MKKILPFITLFFLLACSSDDDNSNPEFVNAVTGRYQLVEAFTAEPLDLNHNGFASANLFEWIHYCNGAKILETCYAVINSNQNYNSFQDYTWILFDLPFSGVNANLNQSYCINNLNTSYDLKIDEVNEELIKVPGDFLDDSIYDRFHARVVDIVWEEEVVYITLEKEFYTANDEWVETILNLVYKKIGEG